MDNVVNNEQRASLGDLLLKDFQGPAREGLRGGAEGDPAADVVQLCLLLLHPDSQNLIVRGLVELAGFWVREREKDGRRRISFGIWTK